MVREKNVGAIRLVNSRSLQLERERLLHKGLHRPVLLYGSEIVVWKEKEKGRIMVAYMEDLRS